ncbi:hypothetical protein AB5N19_07833 [Seiridium cardinale]|uniref:Uncharacterized protein n=1 Tax=Seiridium cardinale TaxID=138064 RepID=A0ABR2Y1Y3_9PEZI
MSWYSSAVPIPPEIWSIVRWVAFFFKMTSLLFAIPLFGLIIFDFFLWVWRLMRKPPRDASPSNKGPRSSHRRLSQMRANAGPANSTSIQQRRATGDKRTGYTTNVDT